MKCQNTELPRATQLPSKAESVLVHFPSPCTPILGRSCQLCCPSYGLTASLEIIGYDVPWGAVKAGPGNADQALPGCCLGAQPQAYFLHGQASLPGLPHVPAPQGILSGGTPEVSTREVPFSLGLSFLPRIPLAHQRCLRVREKAGLSKRQTD